MWYSTESKKGASQWLRVLSSWHISSSEIVANTATLCSLLIPAVGLESLEHFQGGLNICLERRLLTDGFEAILD